MITVSKQAQDKIQEILTKQNHAFFAIEVKSGGCSGLKYQMHTTNIHEQDFDLVPENNNILIAKSSVLFVLGSELDYVREDFNERFEFKNPNIKNKCGCGKSFGV